MTSDGETDYEIFSGKTNTDHDVDSVTYVQNCDIIN